MSYDSLPAIAMLIVYALVKDVLPRMFSKKNEDNKGNGKSGDRSSASWELKMAEIFEKKLEPIVDKLNQIMRDRGMRQ